MDVDDVILQNVFLDLPETLIWRPFVVPKASQIASKNLSQGNSRIIIIWMQKKARGAGWRRGGVPLKNTPKAPALRRIKHAPRALGHGGG